MQSSMNTTLKQNTLTLRVSDELKGNLDRFARLAGRSLSSVAVTAVEEYLAWRIPQLKDLEQAIKEADQKKFASQKEVDTIFAKYDC